MKVRGTPFDSVEWDVSPFSPGQMFWSPSRQLEPVQISQSTIRVRVPCRLDPVVLDYTKLHPTSAENDYKAGEVGIGANLYTYADVTLTKEDDVVVSGDYPLVAKHVALIMKKTTGYSGGFKIKCKSHKHRHVGFSSNGSLYAAVGNAINLLLGRPYQDDLLVKLLAHNYGEESELTPNMLTPGISTGSSLNVALNGGICVTSSDCELVIQRPTPEGTHIIGAIPSLESAGKGPETSDVDVHSLSWVRHIDRFNAAKVCYWLLMDFMPAMIQGDLKTMGNVLYDIMFCGSKMAPLSPMHGGNLLGVVYEQRVSGVEVCFMSSAGPGLVAMTHEKRDTAISIFESHGFQIVEMELDNMGLKTLDH